MTWFIYLFFFFFFLRGCTNNNHMNLRRAYTNTNCAPFLHIGHECPSCCPADSRRTHLPWQWGADNTVHLVARSIVPWPGQRNPSDWRIACVSQRTHTRSPADRNICCCLYAVQNDVSFFFLFFFVFRSNLRFIPLCRRETSRG